MHVHHLLEVNSLRKVFGRVVFSRRAFVLCLFGVKSLGGNDEGGPSPEPVASGGKLFFFCILSSLSNIPFISLNLR